MTNVTSPKFHLTVKVVSRADGQSATACAAYRSGDTIADVREGKIYDFGDKQRIIATAIFVPENLPESVTNWALERSLLWNRVESTERQKNSQVAREAELSIPHGLTQEQGIELAGEFAKYLVERHGVVVDMAVHRDGIRDARGMKKRVGHHAHFLFTTRRLTATGLGEKTREFSSQDKAEVKQRREKCEKNGTTFDEPEHWQIKGGQTISNIRAHWATLANEHLAKAGVVDRIDHRSYADREIDLAPTRHLGPAIAQWERDFAIGKKLEPSEIGSYNHRVEMRRQMLEGHWVQETQALPIVPEREIPYTLPVVPQSLTPWLKASQPPLPTEEELGSSASAPETTTQTLALTHAQLSRLAAAGIQVEVQEKNIILKLTSGFPEIEKQLKTAKFYYSSIQGCWRGVKNSSRLALVAQLQSLPPAQSQQVEQPNQQLQPSAFTVAHDNKLALLLADKILALAQKLGYTKLVNGWEQIDFDSWKFWFRSDEIVITKNEHTVYEYNANLCPQEMWGVPALEQDELINWLVQVVTELEAQSVEVLTRTHDKGGGIEIG